MAVKNADGDDYRDRYVAYLDLLGFKALVEAAETDDAQRARVREALRLVQDSLCHNPRIGMRLTYFSDCLIISTDRTRDGLAEMLASIETLTLNLLQHDIFLRGGLAAGGAHHSTSFVYGTGVNRAVELETEHAGGPLTLVSSEVVADATGYGAAFLAYLPSDGNDRRFINYLNQYAAYRHVPIYSGKAILDRPGARMVNFVCKRLNNDTGRVREKAEWFQRYWNEHVATGGVFERIEAGAPLKDDPGGMTIMVRRIVG